MIKPGDKVVCIDDEWSHLKGYQSSKGIECPLVDGEVYTVTGFEHWSLTEITSLLGQSAIVLQEVKNPTGTHLVGFAVSRFRKLLDISQSMEQLKAISHNPRQGIKV